MAENFKNESVLCCDWGTSSFRLRLVSSNDYSIISEFISPNGVASMFKSWKDQEAISRFEFYSLFLKKSLDEMAQTSSISLNNIPIIVSGMASSTLGLEELNYAELPFDTNGKSVSFKLFNNFNGLAPLFLISGVKSSEDVMRGEEVQLVGLFKLNQLNLQASQNLAFVLPGTHSKHIFVNKGFVYNFKTYMTGELFNIIQEHSILKDSIEKMPGKAQEKEINAFLKGVQISQNSSVLHNIFTVRTNQLFGKHSKQDNLFYLSGLLIGAEIQELKKVDFDQLFVCSGNNLFDYYKLAFNEIFTDQKVIFIEPEVIDKATIAGQIQLFHSRFNNSYE